MVNNRPAIDQSTYDKLINSIYDAAMNAELWPMFLKQ